MIQKRKYDVKNVTFNPIISNYINIINTYVTKDKSKYSFFKHQLTISLFTNFIGFKHLCRIFLYSIQDFLSLHSCSLSSMARSSFASNGNNLLFHLSSYSIHCTHPCFVVEVIESQNLYSVQILSNFFQLFCESFDFVKPLL